jgi:hypothetical protein
MKQKLDPRLLALLEQPAPGATAHEVVDVMIGLDAPLSQEMQNDLNERGFALRSEAGTVLTGSVALANASQLAESPHVLMIELSAPLYREGLAPYETDFTE